MDITSKLWEAITKVLNENNIPFNDFDDLGIVASLPDDSSIAINITSAPADDE